MGNLENERCCKPINRCPGQRFFGKKVDLTHHFEIPSYLME
jgi:hypothetical protein